MDKLQGTSLFLLIIGLIPVIQATACNLQIDTSVSDRCGATGHSAYPAYTCEPSCPLSADEEEVHIINIFKPESSYVRVNISADKAVSVKLLLSSNQLAHWEIYKPDVVTISQVVMTSIFHVYSSVRLSNGTDLDVQAVRRSFRLSDTDGIIEYATETLGKVTSYSAIYETCGWWLKVGDCAIDDTPSMEPLPDLSECTNLLPCWLKYDFEFDLGQIDDRCAGDQYITWYRMEDTTYYVGATLCSNSSERYSLFMGTSLADKFLAISDSDGHGENHCELAGTEKGDLPEVKVELGNVSSTASSSDMIYSRAEWGEPFQKAKIDAVQVPQWYECGVTVPATAGSDQVATGSIIAMVIGLLIALQVIEIGK